MAFVGPANSAFSSGHKDFIGPAVNLGEGIDRLPAPPMKILLRALFPIFSALLPLQAGAEQWSCRYHPGWNPVIICESALVDLPTSAKTATGYPSAKPAWESASAKTFRAIDEQMVIPLLAQPKDYSMLEVLARDVMCGRNASCQVDFANPRAYRAGFD